VEAMANSDRILAMDQGMKVIHIIWSLSVGGAESMLVDILNEQSKTEEVHLVIVNKIESIKLVDKISKKVIIHRINRKPGSRNVLMALLANVKLWRLRSDVLHFHTHELLQFCLFAKWQSTKLFLTLHSTDIPFKNLHQYNKVFAISDSVNMDIKSRSKIFPVTVYNGIRTDLIGTEYDYNHFEFRIVQIGRLYHKIKGQDILLHAIKYLVHSKNVENISVDFIGDGPSGEHLQELARNLNIMDFCNFIGLKNREWIYEKLCEYDLLVQPSRYEGFGLTVAEALAAKVPVLVSNLQGPMEIINNGEYGYYFICENSHDLANKILEIQKQYGSRNFQEKIEAGYAHVVQSYDIKQTALSYLDYYKAI